MLLSEPCPPPAPRLSTSAWPEGRPTVHRRVPVSPLSSPTTCAGPTPSWLDWPAQFAIHLVPAVTYPPFTVPQHRQLHRAPSTTCACRCTACPRPPSAVRCSLLRCLAAPAAPPCCCFPCCHCCAVLLHLLRHCSAAVHTAAAAHIPTSVPPHCLRPASPAGCSTAPAADAPPPTPYRRIVLPAPAGRLSPGPPSLTQQRRTCWSRGIATPLAALRATQPPQRPPAVHADMPACRRNYDSSTSAIVQCGGSSRHPASSIAA